jgi:pimeloyl-ACP methyl ester carboxylesterase
MKLLRLFTSLSGLWTLFLLTGCSSSIRHPELLSHYEEAAASHDQRINPIIVIPGIMGSRLIDESSGKVVWGSYGIGAIRHSSAEGVRTMSIPMKQGTALSALTDQVVQDGALDRLVLNPGFSVSAYARLLQALAIGGYRDQQILEKRGEEHFTCFQFGYDWRRSNADNAARLADFIEDRKAYVEAENLRRFGSRREVKFDIVAHSMGGILARYYLMYGRAPVPADGRRPIPTWAGAKRVERLIQVGTPNGGSAEAMQQLTHGMKLAFILPKFEAGLIGTYPAAYELLPRNQDQVVTDELGKPIDLFDPKIWQTRGWGLADPDQAGVLAELLPDEPDPIVRLKIALDHQRKCLDSARRFQAVMNCKCSLPKGVEMHAFVGTALATVSRLQVTPGGEFIPIKTQPGDGTVTVHSTLLTTTNKKRDPITWSSTHTVDDSHIKMTGNAYFIDDLLNLLLEKPKAY